MSERIRPGDVFKTPDGQLLVESIDRDTRQVVVSDPTVTHPQHARYGQWTVDLGMLALLGVEDRET